MHQYLPAFDLKNSPSVFYAMETAAAVVSTREKKEVPLWEKKIYVFDRTILLICL